ncbi:MAG: LTA synthase family protein, partial [Muribaculaceae bacterium]|nr:LTA synthase family protein [Muribaculaceae bacterium]
MYKKKNILVGAIGRLLVPEALWTRQYLYAWLGCLLTVLAFDVLWCAQTTFRAMGFASTYINALTLATLMSLPAVLTRKSWPLITVMLLVDALMIANLMYCRTYFNAIPLASYLLVGNVIEFTGSIGDSFRWIYLVLPGIAVATVLMLNPEEREKQPNVVFYLMTLGLLALLSGILAMFSGGMSAHIAKLKGECYYATTPPVIYTLFGNLAAEALEHTEEITPEQHRMVAQWGAEHVKYRTTPVAPPDSVGRPDNLVIIFCESLESWPIGAKVGGKELTPNLNKALSDTASTWYAPRVLSQVGNGRSIDGQLLMLAGMYPMRDFVYSMKFADNQYYTIPMAMKEQGAKTYLLSGDKPSTWNQGLVAQSFGIDNTEMCDSWDNSE